MSPPPPHLVVEDQKKPGLNRVTVKDTYILLRTFLSMGLQQTVENNLSIEQANISHPTIKFTTEYNRACKGQERPVAVLGHVHYQVLCRLTSKKW